MVVETDDLFRRNISQHLRLQKYRVFETADEGEAKRIVRRNKVDVVLLGLKGFKQNGLRLLKAIRMARPSTEVILMTPSECLALSIEGMKLGAFDDVLVPFDMRTLLDRIHAACLQRRDSKRERKSALKRRMDKVAAVLSSSVGDLNTDLEILDGQGAGPPEGKKKA